jgi:Zn-dependent protease with chaperone function
MSAAHYFDGRSARLHLVELSTDDGAIHLHGDTTRSYSTAGTRLAEPFAHAPAVLYFADGSHAEVQDPAMRPLLAEALGYRKPWVVRWQEHTAAAVAALVLLVLLIGAGWHWGIPAAAERLSRQVPVSADHALGRHALDLMRRQGILQPSRFSAERQQQLQSVFDRIRPNAPRIALRMAVHHAPQLGANALAFPDGTIVITDELMLKISPGDNDLTTEAVEKLVGVLAHEIGHVEMRHSVHILTRSSLGAALSATLFGDFSAVAAGLPAVMGNMAFSREMELAADDYAVASLRRHGISVVPMANLFDQFDTEENEALPKFLRDTMSYASTHPNSHSRSQRLRRAAEQDDAKAAHAR